MFERVQFRRPVGELLARCVDRELAGVLAIARKMLDGRPREVDSPRERVAVSALEAAHTQDGVALRQMQSSLFNLAQAEQTYFQSNVRLQPSGHRVPVSTQTAPHVAHT